MLKKMIFQTLLMPVALAISSNAFATEEQALPGNAETMGLIAHMVGDQVSLRCDRFELRFAADGKPVSFLQLPEKKELLNVKDPGDGFVVVNRAGESTPLSRLSLADKGKLLVAKTEGSGQEVTFRANIAKTHIGFQVERLIKFSPVPDLTLAFRMNVDASVDAVPHNYMVDSERQGNMLKLNWKNLWNVHKGDLPGGFSIYQYRSADDKDDILLHIWAEEPIAHPKIEGAWTYERAKDWIAKWRARFVPHKGSIVLEDKTVAGLREGLKFAEAAGVSEIYLMPWIWRGEYWPIKKTTAGVNTDIFPKGEEDLKAFAQEVNAKGMYLSFHWVSAGIGFEDPKYVGQHPDRRLASWGGGKIDNAIDEKTAELKFKPDACIYAPFTGSGSSTSFAPGLGHIFNYNIIRVEDELIRFDDLKDTDKPVWTITGCKRGFGSTKAAAHVAGAESAGLIVPYNQNLIPDNWSTLLNEQAEAYAGFINRVCASRVEFDGKEIHHYYGGTGDKLGELIYSGLDHPTISCSSNGRAPAAWFEYRFQGTEKASQRPPGAIVRPRTNSTNAGSLLMADYGLCQTAVKMESMSMGLAAGDRGFNVEAFKQHGLHDQIIERVKMWRAIAGSLTDEQRKKFNVGQFRDPNKRLRQAGNYNEMPYVYVPEDKGNSWDIYPVAVLNTGNQDSLWYHGQENGPIEPWRFVKPNEEHVWTNPFPAQPLRVIMHVLAGTDYRNPENFDLQPKTAVMSQVGDTRFKDENDGLKLSIQNRRDKEVWNQSSLPIAGISCKKNWSDHRPVGMFIDGDGKNEVVVLQVESGMGRDYAVPVDFTGKKYVELPHGEAAYALSKWGWRFAASKNCNYEKLGKINFGFGYLPAGTDADITVSGMKALKEIPVPLVDPVIATAQGKLSIKGQVPTDHYLEYQGGNSATVYDANWNKIGTLPAQAENFTVPNGKTPITIKTAQTGVLPWLEVQFLTRGEPITVKKNGSK